MAPVVDAEPLLTPAEVAKLLNVTATTVSNWSKRGRLPAVITPGGQRRFRRSDVHALMQPVEVAASA